MRMPVANKENENLVILILLVSFLRDRKDIKKIKLQQKDFLFQNIFIRHHQAFVVRKHPQALRADIQNNRFERESGRFVNQKEWNDKFFTYFVSFHFFILP